MMRAITSYLPRILVTQSDFSALRKGQKIQAAILMADISGFTAFSEKLKELGRQGSEEVTKVVNSYFSPFLSIIFKYGGDLINFAGDAINVIFTEDKEASLKEERALAAAIELQQIIQSFGEIHTTVGIYSLGLHIGLHCGDFHIIELGEEPIGYRLAWLGQVLNKAYELTEEAKSGEIILSDSFLKTVKRIASTSVKKSGMNILKTAGNIGVSPVKDAHKDLGTSIKDIAHLSAFLPKGLLDKVKADPSLTRISGEHRKAAAIFLNLWGMDYDKEPASLERLRDFYKDLQGTVKLYDGVVNKIDFCSHGERLMIIYGAPIAHEDDEQRAINTALEIVALAKSHEISFRIGINSGYIFAGDVGPSRRREYSIMGDEVNLAARLMDFARKNEIVISDRVRSKVRGQYELSPVKSIKVKGRDSAVNTSMVLKKIAKAEIKTRWFGEREAIVGRKTERALIDELIDKTTKGSGCILSITGEPGIGKSRLAREVFRSCSRNGFKIFIGNCESYGKDMSYLPWQTMISDYFGFEKNDARETRIEKLTEKMTKIDPILKEWTPIIGETIGVTIDETSFTKSLDAKLRQQRFFDLTLDLFTHEAKNQPVAIIIEDLHWVDNVSLLFINYFARNIKDHKIILCLVYRPVEEELGFIKHDYHSHIKLSEFSSDITADLVKSLLDIDEVPHAILQFVSEKTHGNPLFIEEMTKVLVENGVLSIEDGLLNVKEDLSKITVPDRLESLIISRIDNLGETIKNAIQYASVIGKEFTLDTINAVFPRPATLPESFLALTDHDLLIPKKDGYEFKHIITQEVAYESLAFETRKILHRTIGNFIESKVQENPESFDAILAHHFYKGEDWEKAFGYSIEAGDRAKKSYANLEALAHYDRSLEILDRMDRAGMLPELMKKVLAEIKS